MTENPAKCPICYAFWIFETDSIGRLLARHPIGKCVPRVEESLIELDCEECHTEFVPANYRRTLCDGCRAKRKRVGARKACHKYWVSLTREERQAAYRRQAESERRKIA